MSRLVRAAVVPEHGTPDVVVVDQVDAPALGPGQVRVRVASASVNFPDVLVAAGTYQVTVEPPFVLGSEVAGVVTEVADDVADDVKGFVVGDRVAATMLNGAFAEEIVLGTSTLSRVPDSVDLSVAAAFGVAHRTAYHALRSVAEVGAGDQVIVLGAGGGVGLAAVRLATVLGATVTAVASTQDKLEVAAAHGATHLIAHRGADLRAALREALPGGADVVIDPVGGDLAEPALRTLHYGGRYVIVGFASGTIPRIPLNLVLLKGCQVVGFEFGSFVAHHPDEWRRNEAELDELWAQRRIDPHVGATFALGDVVEALELVASGRAVGKVLLTIADLS